ncbi:phospholipid ABC transporter ATP-binding protein MlaF [Colwellia sp. 4_MG-2023]|jgi:phospholipid/cholesterol/gamma-HCH transport system ATP-binding protein|uniref:phospholipid ABC transporter ATP-binding protein MlaF n=1 Tax=unclassified Colwellia TaxID=196834 RepID=UPI001C09BF89|nr:MULTISPECIES: phospholipid ABC transporter ATP-binding protein MlaF [unclassified Colwellia]MBU2925019.1 phospholipid ABC transporter ATP-binding protein MlaF [Colwellia sp. C2M11]MDO6486424.1 phospholipid ABC transporter ATP-binding protein MlaF [Colwellia sp. 6_MG-2023]MDO6506302.1 phospholipid ABC transporter ATP-binding protein MlaF [Colwellia sp. 5_MG-2023]MDO6555126.1 phospholipid ABC transporter ATP-binding protein MlaF [Colwellia sp. 4_MG-2023]MDO6651688.1 phospholipid ABC transport
MIENDKHENLVDIHNLTFKRGERVIYNDISLSIPTGKVTAIMGPSGIGKTTLLRLIGGQIKPESGKILFAGNDIPQLSRKNLYETRKRMSMLFQSGALFTDMNVYDNIAFPIREHSQLPEAIIEKIVLMKLEAVGLRGARDLHPNELSGGMARRVALARAIALDPELILYDEPFAGQDPISMGVIVRLIRSLSDALGLTSVVVSHDVPEVMSIADYIYIIAEQKIIGQGTPDQIRNHNSSLVKQFVHGEADGPVPFHFEAPNYQNELIKGSNALSERGKR